MSTTTRVICMLFLVPVVFVAFAALAVDLPQLALAEVKPDWVPSAVAVAGTLAALVGTWVVGRRVWRGLEPDSPE